MNERNDSIVYRIEEFGCETDVVLEYGTYRNNGTLAVSLYCQSLDADGRKSDSFDDLYDVITVNLPDSAALPPNCQYVDENNHPVIGSWLTENQIAERVGRTCKSGLCSYPVYYFFQAELFDIPRGGTKEDIKARREIIKDFYASWIATHPEKRVWNKSLRAYIHVKFLSINEALGHAPRSFEATLAQTHLSEILADSILFDKRPAKCGDKNQKSFEKILFLRWNNCRVLIGRQRTSGDLVLYYISGGGYKKEKAVR